MRAKQDKQEPCDAMAQAVRRFTIETGLMMSAQTLILMALILAVKM